MTKTFIINSTVIVKPKVHAHQSFNEENYISNHLMEVHSVEMESSDHLRYILIVLSFQRRIVLKSCFKSLKNVHFS